MDETWKEIKGYEGIYQISSLGRVRCIANSGRYTGRIMRPVSHGKRYLYITLWRDGRRKNHYIHRLVATAFVDNPNGFDVVNHIDYDTENNAASNLEWTTQGDNVRYSRARMCKPRMKPMTNTGERYICFRKSRMEYRLQIPGDRERRFKSLNEAVEKRKEILGA